MTIVEPVTWNTPIASPFNAVYEGDFRPSLDELIPLSRAQLSGCKP